MTDTAVPRPPSVRWWPPSTPDIPRAWAEQWDRVGLVLGDFDTPVDQVLCVVDCVPETVEEAVAAGADLIVAHHPLLLKGVSSVAPDTYKGRIVHRLIKADVALYVAHTNADVANPGVSDALGRPARPDGAAPAGAAARQPATGGGRGRPGRELAEPMTLAELTAFAARQLPATAAGVRAAGDPDRIDPYARGLRRCGRLVPARCRRGGRRRVPLRRPAAPPGQRASRRRRSRPARRRPLGERAALARRGGRAGCARSSASPHSCPISTPTPGPCTRSAAE